MDGGNWSWADLKDDKLNMLLDAEQTLGVDVLLAYEEGKGARVAGEMLAMSGLQVASMNESQVECLQGLEQKLGAVVIGYKQG